MEDPTITSFEHGWDRCQREHQCGAKIDPIDGVEIPEIYLAASRTRPPPNACAVHQRWTSPNCRALVSLQRRRAHWLHLNEVRLPGLGWKRLWQLSLARHPRCGQHKLPGHRGSRGTRLPLGRFRFPHQLRRLNRCHLLPPRNFRYPNSHHVSVRGTDLYL